MEEFRTKLQRKTTIVTVLCCLLPIITIAAKMFFKLENDFSSGMTLGICCGSMLVVVYYLVRNFMILHNEEKLKKLYIEQTDERNEAICKEAMKTSSFILIIVFGIASIITGFIDQTICMTLCAVIYTSAFVTVVVKKYYSSKM